MRALLILSPGFPESENDTSCLPAVQQFVLAMKDQTPELRLIILSFQYPFKKGKYFWNGIEIIAFGGKNRPGPARLYNWIRVYRQLKILGRENQIVGLLSLWLGECALVGEFFAKRYKLKHYMWLHGQDAKAENKYVKRINPDGSSIIAISDFIKDEFKKNHHILPFMIVENGVTPHLYPKLNEGSRPYDILGVGSLIPLKNYTLFIEIIFELKKIYPEIKAGIAGTGNEECELKKLAAVLNLESNIDFFGLLPHSGILDLMNASKILLHTSYYEGNSTVMAEALYSGCQVVSTQSLSNAETKNTIRVHSKEEMIKTCLALLQASVKPERVIFNEMRTSAKKIINLFC